MFIKDGDIIDFTKDGKNVTDEVVKRSMGLSVNKGKLKEVKVDVFDELVSLDDCDEHEEVQTKMQAVEEELEAHYDINTDQVTFKPALALNPFGFHKVETMLTCNPPLPFPDVSYTTIQEYNEMRTWVHPPSTSALTAHDYVKKVTEADNNLRKKITELRDAVAQDIELMTKYALSSQITTLSPILDELNKILGE